jgi:hypothetical protein
MVEKKMFCLTLCLKSACALHEHGKENGLFLLDMLEGERARADNCKR